MPWLESANLLVDWKDKTWNYPDSSVYIAVDRPETFIERIKDGNQVFILSLFISDRGVTIPKHALRVLIVGSGGTLLEEYKDYADVFLEESTGILLSYIEFDHRIDLESGK